MTRITNTLFLTAALITYMLSPAHAEKETYGVKLRAQVIDGICDMERNPDSPECLDLIIPEAGDTYETETTSPLIDSPESCPAGYVCEVENYE